MSSTADLIRDLRTQRKLSVAAFADLVGVAENTVYRWERGELTPTWERLKSMGDALDADLCVSWSFRSFNKDWR